MKSIHTLICIILSISFCVAQEVSEVPEFKTGRAAGNSLEKKMKKSPKKILINTFRVNYQILFTDWEGTRAGVYTGKTSAELTVAFNGMEEADYQKITDDLYANYLSYLDGEGYEVISSDVLANSKAVKNFSSTSGGSPSYELIDGYISTTPTGFTYYSKDNGKAPLAGKMKGCGAVVADITLNIPFIVDSESGASKLATKAVGGVSKIVVSPSLRIESNSTIRFTDPEVLAVIISKMKDPMMINGVFKDAKFKASAAAQTNTAYRMGHVVNVYSTDVNTSKMQVAECDPEKYKAGVLEAMRKLTESATNHFIHYND
ncbi:MAG: hypothetical protein NXI20_20850 [bacterium]|nr:hypothetical protein [bacterium]